MLASIPCSMGVFAALFAVETKDRVLEEIST
jgi:hypothetical protein